MSTEKIAYITCVTDKAEYEEQLFYLERQILPEGFELEVIPVKGASSMASGYNHAMRSHWGFRLESAWAAYHGLRQRGNPKKL